MFSELCGRTGGLQKHVGLLGALLRSLVLVGHGIRVVPSGKARKFVSKVFLLAVVFKSQELPHSLFFFLIWLNFLTRINHSAPFI